MNKVALGLLPWFALQPLAAAIAAEVTDKKAETLEQVEVVDVSPLQFGAIDINKIPANVQTVSAEQLQAGQAVSLADYMNRYLGSVNINDAQNNPLQPDLQYRGYSASPLMGVPQGIAAYVNGVRFNEPFGDMVNWDLIPQGAIESMSLQPASNPAFGLNALGGSINIKTKTGFSAPKHVLEVQGGSWDRHTEELSSGWNNGTWGYFADFSNFSEAGWRDHSRTEAKRGFGTLSWRGNESSLDLHFAGTENALRGNGAVPEELLAYGREKVFTHPDLTRNRLFMVSLDGETWLNERNQLSATAYYRRNKMSTYNGDGSEFGDCEVGGVDYLCDGDEPLQALDGSLIPENPALEGGTVNTSETTQQSFGFALQNAFHHKVFGMNNQLIAGASYDHSTAHYRADTELGSLTANRGVAAGGVFLLDSRVRLNTETNNYGVFLTDTLSVTDKLDVTVSGRYNITHLELKDHFPGDDPDENLTGFHTFNRINPAAGLTYAFMPELTFYGNYSESSRVPTPMELSCADPDNPCKLPNAFVADPPLAQVVANTWEAGLRGDLKKLPFEGRVHWNAGFFHVINNNDILWQGNGAVNGMGYFENVGKTQRQGAEAGLSGLFFDNRWRWSANYTYIDATYQSPFGSPNGAHPDAVDGVTQVRPGDRIPGIPAHIAKFSTDVDILPQWTLGFDMSYNSGQYLRGDEANLLPKIPAFVVFNLRSEYRFNEHVALFGRVNNLFDREYANFGAIGETGEVLQGLGLNENENARFVGVGAPRAAWVGIRLSM
ncbi:TonB-dependent receptor [Methylomonas sp. SURF-2]|uniref:TonB-dependent receptor n=1 Tax=Methylomonas subterranea TaxID=2952225 RepID=A0ABT1TG43_9GAMM|nr:TonB-dependent receptor [Methylomonas sp. SURF-2]MCQ8104221.1 TonB-dependent receptor [Methylomonas sp. SURF-2]